MKQIEKLAKDFSKIPINLVGPFTVDSGILNLIVNEREIAYQAGFLKAREMASQETLVDLAGARMYPAGKSLLDVIEAIGESEAE